MCELYRGGHAPSQLRYYHIAVSDSSTVDIVSHVSNLLPWVERQLSAEDSMLIYCKQGVSRSCTVMLALYCRDRRGVSFMRGRR